jgi:hypothetical protein
VSFANAPAIASIGAPPDRHAERILDDMLRFLQGQQKQLWANAAGSLTRKQMGTPVGQQRAVRRFTQAASPLLLDVRLWPAKRGKYTLLLNSWMVWDPGSGGMAVSRLPPPALAWLAVTTALSTGANHSSEWECGALLLVTRHACIRLAQRANSEPSRIFWPRRASCGWWFQP